MIFAVVGTLPARGAVACELLTLPTETSAVHLVWFIFDSTAVLDQPLHQERRPQFLFKHEYIMRSLRRERYRSMPCTQGKRECGSSKSCSPAFVSRATCLSIVDLSLIHI